MYVMAPWAGRINDNLLRWSDETLLLPATYGKWALHGTVQDRAAEVIEHLPDRLVLSLDLGPSWPWPGHVRTSWELDAQTLRTRIELHAHDTPFPGVVGWHPWFRRRIGESHARWHVSSARMAERDDDYQLTGALLDVARPHGTFDDAFHIPQCAVSLEWADHLTLDIVNSHPWFVIFDARSETVCIEPQSGPPNGVNNGLVDEIAIVHPNDPLIMRTEWRVRRDGPLG